MTKSALETLIENEMAKEFNRGLREARSIDLGESSFGATRSAVGDYGKVGLLLCSTSYDI